MSALSVKRQETRWLVFTVIRDGVAVDLTGATLTFAVKRTKSDPAALIIKTDGDFDKTQQASGIVSVLLTSTDLDQEAGPYVGELTVAYGDADNTIEKSADITIQIEAAVTA